MTTQKADLLIENGTVLTMNSSGEIIENGAVAVREDKIVAVEKKAHYSNWDIERVVDARDGLIMPGLINVHTHAAMTCMRGLADDLPLMTWLNDHIFPAESKLDYEQVFTGSLLACAEMIMSGTTCFCDMYLFEDAVARAAKQAGIRAIVGEVLYDFPSPNYGSIENGFEYTLELAQKWAGDPLISIAVEPHSPYLCAPDLLEKAFTIVNQHELLMVIHLSETASEVDQIKEKYGLTPVEHLAGLGVLSPRLLACHCVMLSEEDINLLKQYDVKIAHNPESNMKLASGIAPLPELLDAGICVGIGTDGCASNNNLDMFLEMDTVAKIHKVNSGDPTVTDAWTVLKMATIGGARALGIDHITGSLEPGKKADIIVIDTHKPHLTPMYNPASHLVYAAKGSDVAVTVIDGKMIFENGQLNTIDLKKTMEDVKQVAGSIRENAHGV
jgi:5-methylthioadenosine/S-adenosylhomocysteine deaminase